MDVQFIRLKTGVDIISEYELDDTGALVTLINPFVMESMLKGGHPVVFLESWLPTQVLSTNTVVMPAENIMFFAEVEDRFLMSYLQLVVKELQTKTIIKEQIEKLMEGKELNTDMEEELEGIKVLETIQLEGNTLH